MTMDKPPTMEPLTPAELERFLATARAEGRLLTAAERAAIFDSSTVAKPRPVALPTPDEMEAAPLDAARIDQLQQNFFPELGDPTWLPSPRLVQGIIFDFDDTLAYLSQPLDELMAKGAQTADAYMRSTGMALPPDFWPNIIEARRFAQEKSEQEKEEHLADDAMSFLLQFFGYPASKLDPDVLKQAVDLFYAPEMSAWRLHPKVLPLLQSLQREGYKLGLIANYNCDRVFQRIVDYLGLRPFFDICLASAAVEYRKPDEKIFNIVLERWGALPYEVIVVGDSLLHDIKGGIEVGALTVQACLGSPAQVSQDNALVAEQIVPDATIDDLSQLPALIAAWA